MPWTGTAPSQQFTRSDGVRTGDDVFVQQAAAPVDIEPTLLDAHATDIKDGLNACLKKDGGNTATADIPMGGNTLTNIAAAGARTEPARFSDVQDNLGQYVATVGGTADVITLTPTIAITAYAAGQRFSFLASGDNTGATTVNVSAVGAKAVVRNDGANTALSAGDIQSGAIVDIEYDGTRFQLINFSPLSGNISLASGTVISWNSGDVTITHSANALAFAGASSGYSFDAVVKPASSDGAALGSGSVMWSDLFLASGGVVNFNNGDVTITHSANALAFAGATGGYSFDDDLLLPSGGVINWNSGDVTITHSANTLALAGASSGYTFDALVSSTASMRAHSGTAIPAGGTAGAGLLVSSTSNFGIFFGSGAPTLAAAQGSIYLQSDGGGDFYVNEDGGTTWREWTLG